MRIDVACRLRRFVSRLRAGRLEMLFARRQDQSTGRDLSFLIDIFRLFEPHRVARK